MKTVLMSSRKVCVDLLRGNLCVSVDWHSVSVDCQLVPVAYRRVLVVIPCLLAPLVALSQGDQSQFLEVFSAHLPVVRSTRRGGLQTA